MGDHVFVCYAREDKGFVLQLGENLKGQDVPVWLDQWNIPPGSDWDRSIDNAIRDCAKFIIVLSEEAVESSEVRGELRVALDEKKPIIPVLHRSCRVPRQLRTIQYVDFSSRGPDDEVALNQLLRTLGGAAGEGVAQRIQTAEASVGNHKPTSTSDFGKGTGERARLKEERKEREVSEGTAGNAETSGRDDTTTAGQKAGFTFWLAFFIVITGWLVISPVLIHGVLVGPNWLIVIPFVTLLMSFIRPIKLGYAVTITFLLHAINLSMSLFYREVWEKDQGLGTIAMLSGVVALNCLLAGTVSWYRIHGLKAGRFDSLLNRIKL
jgi:hypothetical protein